MDARQLFLQGRRHMQLFEPRGFEEAVASLWEAIDVDPSFPLSYSALAETYSYWGFRKEISGGEAQSYYDLALQQAGVALKQAPQRAESHRACAMALRRGRNADPERRLRAARRAVELDPMGAENWYELWRCMDYRPEDGAVRRALELNPALFAALNDLGAAHCERGEYQEAVFRFRQALEVNPSSILARCNLAMVFARQGRGEEARAELRLAAEQDPDDELLRRDRAFLENMS